MVRASVYTSKSVQGCNAHGLSSMVLHLTHMFGRLSAVKLEVETSCFVSDPDLLGDTHC